MLDRIKERDLHLPGAEAEYYATPPDERNVWQRWAVATHGLAGPADLVTYAGFGLVMKGLYDIYESDHKKGITEVGVGRGLDLVDGLVAKYTKTRSPSGEIKDVVADKVELLAATYMLRKMGYLPEPAFYALLGRETVAYGLTTVGQVRGVETHANEASKRHTYWQWASIIGGYIPSAIAGETEKPELSKTFRKAGNLMLLANAKSGIDGVIELSQQAFATAA